MATRLHFGSTVGTDLIAGLSERNLDDGTSSGPFNQALTLSSGGNHLTNFNGIDVFIYRVDAVTISGTITFNMNGNESVMTANAQFAGVISRYDNSGNFISDIVAQGNANHADGVEASTTAGTDHNWTATPTSTSMSAGDWIVVTPHADAIGTMGTGTLTLQSGGSVSWVEFTETITAFSGAAAASFMVARRNRTRSLR